MTLSAKWTAVTFSALTALGAGSFAFAGCTVTSGDPDNTEAGTGNNPPVDGGGGTDTSVVTPVACTGNTKQTTKFAPAACQAALDEECCAELTACFTTPTVAATQDCNVFVSCVDDCNKPVDGGAPTEAEVDKCIADFCLSNSPTEIAEAYNKIIDCKEAKPKSIAACN